MQSSLLVTLLVVFSGIQAFPTTKPSSSSSDYDNATPSPNNNYEAPPPSYSKPIPSATTPENYSVKFNTPETYTKPNENDYVPAKPQYVQPTYQYGGISHGSPIGSLAPIGLGGIRPIVPVLPIGALPVRTGGLGVGGHADFAAGAGIGSAVGAGAGAGVDVKAAAASGARAGAASAAGLAAGVGAGAGAGVGGIKAGAGASASAAADGKAGLVV